MSRRRRPKADAALVVQLDVVYAELPTIACKGLCQASGGPVVQARSMTRVELLRMQDSGGERRGRQQRQPLTCPYLTAGDETGRCSIYEARPFLCRLWGVSVDMPCPHGCEVTPRLLSVEEGRMAMAFAENIGGRLAPDPVYTHLAQRMIGTNLDTRRRVTIGRTSDDV